MRPSIRIIAAAAILVVLLAACGTTAAPSAEPTVRPSSPIAEPSTTPSSAPSETPHASLELAGTLTMVDGVAAGGPGGTIEDALASGITDPMLVNGALFNDGSGRLYLATSISDASAPTFEGPMLEVIGYPENTADWDMANADLTGLQEANGVLFFENAQLFGVVES